MIIISKGKHRCLYFYKYVVRKYMCFYITQYTYLCIYSNYIYIKLVVISDNSCNISMHIYLPFEVIIIVKFLFSHFLTALKLTSDLTVLKKMIKQDLHKYNYHDLYYNIKLIISHNQT